MTIKPHLYIQKCYYNLLNNNKENVKSEGYEQQQKVEEKEIKIA